MARRLKKSLEDALLIAAQTGRTGHEILIRVSEAREINRAHGGPLIAAWEVDLLPDDWIEVLTSMPRLDKLSAGLQELEDYKATWRSSHPTYRKH